MTSSIEDVKLPRFTGRSLAGTWLTLGEEVEWCAQELSLETLGWLNQLFRNHFENRPTVPQFPVSAGRCLLLELSLPLDKIEEVEKVEDGFDWYCDNLHQYGPHPLDRVLYRRIACFLSDTYVELPGIQQRQEDLILEVFSHYQAQEIEVPASPSVPPFSCPGTCHSGDLTPSQLREALRILNNLSNYKPSAVCAALECDRDTSEELSDAFDQGGAITALSMLARMRDEQLKALIETMSKGRI